MTGSSPTCDSSHNDMLISVNALTNFVLHVPANWRTRWGATAQTVKVREASHRLPRSPPVYQVCHCPVLHLTTLSNHRSDPDQPRWVGLQRDFNHSHIAQTPFRNALLTNSLDATSSNPDGCGTLIAVYAAKASRV